MANPANRSILLDHQMIVDGVLMQERKDLVKTLNDETGVEESHLTHTRVIGEKSCTAKQSITDGEKEDEVIGVIETDMNDSELENFKNEWEEKWSRAHILELLDATTKKKPNSRTKTNRGMIVANMVRVHNYELPYF